MKVDIGLSDDLDQIGEAARCAEDRGYDGILTAETNADPFLQALMAMSTTREITVGTAIAVAFARSPMTLASTANELQRFSRGRFTLGLGSQVQAHVERRYSMPWSKPAARMRDFVMATRAIWDCWNGGTKLDYRGAFYTHTLMPPFFKPVPHEFGPPKVYLAAVGERMTRVAGEVADGLILHSFTTERFIRERTRPALEKGLVEGGRPSDTFDICLPVLIATGDSDEELEQSILATKRQIAFYGSTPTYRAVLELHGWESISDELLNLSRAGEWEAMGNLITDEMLDAFAVVAKPGEIGAALLARFDGLVDRVSLGTLSGETAAFVHAGLRTSTPTAELDPVRSNGVVI